MSQAIRDYLHWKIQEGNGGTAAQLSTAMAMDRLNETLKQFLPGTLDAEKEAHRQSCALAHGLANAADLFLHCTKSMRSDARAALEQAIRETRENL